MTKQQILDATYCGDIFKNNIEEIKKTYKILAKKYHPDINKDSDSSDILSKLNLLYEDAIKKVGTINWQENNIVIIKPLDSSPRKYKFLSENYFELGKFYINRNFVIYILDNQHEKYYNNAIRMIKNIKYSNPDMKKEFGRYIPKIKDKFKTHDGKYCVIFEKTEDMFLLKDLLEYKNGKIDDKHVAWIVSRLSNISCFLNYNNIINNSITLNHLYISPKFHTIITTGGWWYATKESEKLIGAPKSVFEIMSPNVKTNKVSENRTDLEAIKYIGKQLLGLNGLSDVKDSKHHIELKRWLNKGASNDPINEYNLWSNAIDKIWGKRKFIEFKVSEKDIYNKK